MWVVLAGVVVLAIGCSSHHGATSDAASHDGPQTVDALATSDAPMPADALMSDDAIDGSTGQPTTISVTLPNRPNDLAMFDFLVAYQDGDGPWTLAPAPTGDTYTFDVSSRSWGVVWTCAYDKTANRTSFVSESHFAVSERTSLTMNVADRCTDRPPATFVLMGTVSNTTTGTWLVDFGNSLTATVNSTTHGYIIRTLPGTRDIVLRHVQGTGSTLVTTEALVERDVMVNANTTHNLDASGVVPTRSFGVDVTGANGAAAEATTILYSAGGTAATMDQLVQSHESDALAQVQSATGDVYDQQITVTNAGATSIVTNATSMPTDQSYAAPAPLGGTGTTIAATTPYPIINSTWSAYPSAVGYTWMATQNQGPALCGSNRHCFSVWSTTLSPGVIGQSPSYRMPDLTALAGWSSDLGFMAGASIVGYVEAASSSAGAGDFPPVTPPVNGTQRTYARSAFTVTP